MPNDLAIWSTALAKSFGAKTALAGLDLSVPAGSVFALLGPNGAGKTTAVRVLSTLARPDGGRASVAGFDVVAQRHEVRRRISLTGQDVTLDALQTGRETLEMMGRLGRLSARAARERASELLDRFGLSDAADQRVGTYSGGMRRKLDLAAGLLRQPEVIFLDEPTTGLDPRARAATWDVITAEANAGITVFLTTQYLDEADRLAGCVAVMANGGVVAQGSPDELKARVGGQQLDLWATDGASYEELVRKLAGAALRTGPEELHIVLTTPGEAAKARALMDKLDPDGRRIKRFTLSAATLDDVFMALTATSATEGNCADD
ncbi:MAG TPA: ATP-binding cassette domain-containing protein [Acidimicrobiales bacterium]|nr:ATP-binding cassette domain-containing protein [Acidimicrobiales bacterium]